jgi:hypothetical protein
MEDKMKHKKCQAPPYDIYFGVAVFFILLLAIGAFVANNFTGKLAGGLSCIETNESNESTTLGVIGIGTFEDKRENKLWVISGEYCKPVECDEYWGNDYCFECKETKQ